jgi:hypothetical protein
MASMTARHRPALQLALRLLAIVPFGYLMVALWVSAAGGWLAKSGWLVRSDAVALSAMAGFVAYLVFMVWAFAERRLARLWGVTLGGCALATVLLRALGVGV